MRPGTIVRLPDGREGTVVFHGLMGYGIKWGRHNVTEDDLAGTVGDLGMLGIHGRDVDPDTWEWDPDALLREPWPGALLPCVGSDYEVVP